jgi:hypothetical protein
MILAFCQWYVIRTAEVVADLKMEMIISVHTISMSSLFHLFGIISKKIIEFWNELIRCVTSSFKIVYTGLTDQSFRSTR